MRYVEKKNILERGAPQMSIRRMRISRCITSGWPLVPKFAGSNPAEAVGFLVRKNPQCSFLRRGSKAVGLMS